MADSVVTGRAWEVAPARESPDRLSHRRSDARIPSSSLRIRRTVAARPSRHHGPACSCPRKEHQPPAAPCRIPPQAVLQPPSWHLHSRRRPRRPSDSSSIICQQSKTEPYVPFLYQFYSGLTASSHGSSCLRRALLSAPHQGLCVGTPRNRVRRRDVVRGIAKCRHSQHRRGYPAMISSSRSAPAPQPAYTGTISASPAATSPSRSAAPPRPPRSRPIPQ